MLRFAQHDSAIFSHLHCAGTTSRPLSTLGHSVATREGKLCFLAHLLSARTRVKSPSAARDIMPLSGAQNDLGYLQLFCNSEFTPLKPAPYFIVGLERLLPYNAVPCHTARTLTHP